MAMRVYTVETGGKYISVAEGMARLSAGETRGVYINLTNRCNCACTFCLRGLKHMGEEATLWYGGEEPTAADFKADLATVPWEKVSEAVVCGFGEPTMRQSVLCEVLRFMKETHPEIPTRLNTNGLGNLEHGRDITKDFAGLLDTISISLNASNAERYLALTRSRHGLGSFDAMLDFAVRAKAVVPYVVMTVVDKVEDAAEIALCRKICDEKGLTLRVRAYEGN